MNHKNKKNSCWDAPKCRLINTVNSRFEKGEAWYKAIFPEKANKRKKNKKRAIGPISKKAKKEQKISDLK